MLPYRIAMLDTVELHTEQEIHFPFGRKRTGSDVEGPGILRSLHSCHHSSGQLPCGYTDVERVSRDWNQYGTQLRVRVSLSEIFRF